MKNIYYFLKEYHLSPLVFIAKYFFFIVLRRRSWGVPFGEFEQIISLIEYQKTMIISGTWFWLKRSILGTSHIQGYYSPNGITYIIYILLYGRDKEAVQTLLHTLQMERERADGAVFLSWLELSFLLYVLQFSHPIEVSQNGRTVWQITSMVPAAQHGQLTVGARIRFVKSCLRLVDSVFCCGMIFVSHLDLSRFHVHPSLPGVALYVSCHALQQLDEALSQWTSHRAVRTMNDLYRPLGI